MRVGESVDIHSESVPPVTQLLIQKLVAAVREGEDETIRRLIERLADVADAPALLLLRELLNEDLVDNCSEEVVPALPDYRGPERPVR